MEELIRKIFNNNSNIKYNFNTCGIITNDFEKAKNKFIEIYKSYPENDISFFSIGEESINLELANGFQYFWYRPNSGMRSCRFRAAMIDENITEEELLNVIPCCYLCNKNNVEIF